ncbi:hypothetical protein G647_06811 [Cladophialophora carrionii CBS 160.54]|uniref:F-box domain-containing protein n=1 Tax=Cladophialophora carrionii CBS 160.54 TaxID=1279043 RepID=V9D783_9EURO|nr:uncharacterized protein G647_06811 [Cladophialophora carrionii CBS 160.54]ETI22735.1 hypothetical protein G647_06811 [Cladophialophora carrionii CBS 160.54]
MVDDVPSTTNQLRLSLLDILSNSIILDGILPYLSLSSTFALARTSHALRDLVLNAPRAFRYVDLSKCRGAYVPPNLLTRIDSGGHSWRAERMDEHLTEDEFYAGPLRGVLGKLRRMHVLQGVHTLVLDDLASVTVDLINDIVTAPEYDVRLLSIRRCLNINQPKLQQLLCHLCRPGRPEGTPRLQGLYVFTPPISPTPEPFDYVHAFHYNLDTMGVLGYHGAQPGAQHKTNCASGSRVVEPWYAASGQVISQGHAQRSSWEETLQTCKGIISFDAVLCSHMHADMAPVLHVASRDYLSKNKPGIPPLATVALGPTGCAGCGRNPHGAPVWGESEIRDFPLLWPPPRSGKLIDAVRPPPCFTEDGQILLARLIVSCTWCLTNRHCDSCHRWWCADCYNPKLSRQLITDIERLSTTSAGFLPANAIKGGSSEGDRVKVFNGLCVENCLVGEWMAGAGGGGMWG